MSITNECNGENECYETVFTKSNTSPNQGSQNQSPQGTNSQSATYHPNDNGSMTDGVPPQRNAAEESTSQPTPSPKQYDDEDWDPAHPARVGSILVLSDQDSERYQKFSHVRQTFKHLMGPFHITNPTSGLSMMVDSETCVENGMPLKAAPDNHDDVKQQFYLGQHGSLFSAPCPGLVMSVSDSPNDNSIKLETFVLGEKKQKWQFRDGTVASVLYPEAVIGAVVSRLVMCCSLTCCHC